MNRLLLNISLILATIIPALGQPHALRGYDPSAPPRGRSEAEKKILAVLDDIVKSHHTYLSVPMVDGRALRLLTEAAAAKNVVEIGTSTGYSGLWLSLALQATGGHLTTFEYDHGRASMARDHFRKAGVEQAVTIVEGDAHENVTKLKGPIDVAFIDADKDGYMDYLHKVLPLVRPGGLILAHNVEMVPDYVKAVTTSADLETVFYMEGGGLGVTLKKR
jgi:predicted O-methyltransferase YrrM